MEVGIVLASVDLMIVGENSSRQIVALARQGMGAEDIARELELEVGAVKLVLGANNVGSELDRDINDEQLIELRNRAFLLAMQDADIGVSARMTMFLIERDKPRKTNDGSSISIQTINQAILAANTSFSDLAKDYLEKPA